MRVGIIIMPIIQIKEVNLSGVTYLVNGEVYIQIWQLDLYLAPILNHSDLRTLTYTYIANLESFLFSVFYFHLIVSLQHAFT